MPRRGSLGLLTRGSLPRSGFFGGEGSLHTFAPAAGDEGAGGCGRKVPPISAAGQVGGSVAALCKSRCALRNFILTPASLRGGTSFAARSSPASARCWLVAPARDGRERRRVLRRLRPDASALGRFCQACREGSRPQNCPRGRPLAPSGWQLAKCIAGGAWGGLGGA